MTAGGENAHQGSWLSDAWSLCRRDLGQFFSTPMAWLLIAAWAFITNLLFYFDLTAILAEGGASSQPLQYGALSTGALAMILIIPAVTMHSFAAERQQGTLRLLLSLPLSDSSLIVGKIAAACCLLGAIAATSLGQVITVALLSDVIGATIISAYIGLLLVIILGSCLGVWISLMVDSIVAAFVLTASALALLFLLSLVASEGSAVWPPLAWLGTILGLGERLWRLLAGDLRLADVVWFIAASTACIVLARVALHTRRRYG